MSYHRGYQVISTNHQPSARSPVALCSFNSRSLPTRSHFLLPTSHCSHTLPATSHTSHLEEHVAALAVAALLVPVLDGVLAHQVTPLLAHNTSLTLCLPHPTLPTLRNTLRPLDWLPFLCQCWVVSSPTRSHFWLPTSHFSHSLPAISHTSHLEEHVAALGLAALLVPVLGGVLTHQITLLAAYITLLSHFACHMSHFSP
jgi:hypothetical protein